MSYNPNPYQPPMNADVVSDRDLERRIKRLERSVRHHKWALWASYLFMVACTLIALIFSAIISAATLGYL